MPRSRFLPVLLAVLAAIAFASPASAVSLLGATFNPGTLYDVNPASGTASNPRATLSQLAGIEFVGNVLYGLTTFENGNSLYTINPATGASTLVGSTGLDHIIEGDLAWDSSSSTLYGMWQDEMSLGERRLFTLDLGTGAATLVGELVNLDDPSGLAFDGAGNLWLIDSNVNTSDPSRLHQIDPSTAAVLSTTDLSSDLSVILGMAFDPASGTMYVSDFNLYTLDTATGNLSLIGPTGLPIATPSSIHALTVAPVPEPSLALVLAGGLAGLAAGQRPRRS